MKELPGLLERQFCQLDGVIKAKDALDLVVGDTFLDFLQHF